jgi:hypothetical protein
MDGWIDIDSTYERKHVVWEWFFSKSLLRWGWTTGRWTNFKKRVSFIMCRSPRKFPKLPNAVITVFELQAKTLMSTSHSWLFFFVCAYLSHLSGYFIAKISQSVATVVVSLPIFLSHNLWDPGDLFSPCLYSKSCFPLSSDRLWTVECFAYLECTPASFSVCVNGALLDFCGIWMLPLLKRLLYFFGDRVYLCSPGWFWTQNPLALAS